MGIDRIGKGSVAPPGPTEPKGVGPADGTRAFEVKRPMEGSNAAAVASARVEPSANGPLEQLRAGKIDVNGYVDLKVDAATAHLHGMGATELGELKKMLRDQIVSDPALSDLVKQATGSAPTPHDD